MPGAKIKLLAVSILCVVGLALLAFSQASSKMLVDTLHRQKEDEIHRLSAFLAPAVASNSQAELQARQEDEIRRRSTLLSATLAFNANASSTERSEPVIKKACRASRSFEIFETSLAHLQSGLIKKSAHQIASEWDKVLPQAEKNVDKCGNTPEDVAWVKSIYRAKFLAHAEPCDNIKKFGGTVHGNGGGFWWWWRWWWKFGGNGGGDGQKFLCVEKVPKGNCLVYSLGSRNDFSFEAEIVAALQCKVHTFDCTVDDVRDDQLPNGVTFHPWCIGGEDKLKPFSNSGGKNVQFYTMRTVMQKLQHSYIDILKMDIERHEFAVIKTLACPGCFGQAAIEFHLNNVYSMFGQALSYDEWEAAWESLVCENGLRPFSYDTSSCDCCVEYGFLYVNPQ